MISRQTYFYLPILVFGFIWMSVLVLYQVSPLELYPIQSETVLLFFASVLMVIIGYLLYRFFFMEEKIQFYSIQSDWHIQLNYKKLFYILLILNIIISIAIYIFIMRISEEQGGLASYLSNPLQGRMLITKLGQPKYWDIKFAAATYVISTMTLSLILGGILFTADNKLFKLFSLTSIFIVVVYGLFIFSRNNLIYAILIWLFSLIFTSYYLPEKEHRKNIKSVLIIIFFFAIFFLLFSYIILSLRYSTSPEKEISRIFLEQLNYYITGNVVGFDQYLRHDLPLEWGASIFRSIFKWLVRLGLWPDLKVMETNYTFLSISRQLQTNTFAYIRVLYEDYGIIGLMGFSLLLGWIAAKVSYSYSKNFSVLKLYLVVVFSFTFFMSFFGFHFVNLSKFLFNVGFVLVFQILFAKKIYRLIPVKNCDHSKITQNNNR